VSALVRYCVDPQASRFTVQAFAGGPLSAVGHNPTFAIRDFRGEVEFDPKEPAAGSLRMVIAAASLALTNSVSDKDRHEIERTTQNQVLESDRFAEIRYDCPASRITAIGPMQLVLAGDLTLHGVTRPQTVSARVYLMGGTLRGQGETIIRQTEFGIRPVTVAGGMLKVKDELKLVFDVVARAVLAGESTATRRSGAEPCVT
jgi:polyisoprenoid-binding protein YceI